jgi:hypothetical protein
VDTGTAKAQAADGAILIKYFADQEARTNRAIERLPYHLIRRCDRALIGGATNLGSVLRLGDPYGDGFDSKTYSVGVP